jgi:hypothetical protein
VERKRCGAGFTPPNFDARKHVLKSKHYSSYVKKISIMKKIGEVLARKTKKKKEK